MAGYQQIGSIPTKVPTQRGRYLARDHVSDPTLEFAFYLEQLTYSDAWA